MSLFAKVTMSALAGAMLAATVATASAAPTIRIAPIEAETSQATQVGHRHRRHWHGHGHGYGWGYQHCFWKKKKFWGYYGPYWKRIKVCYH